MGALLFLGSVLYFFTNVQRVAVPGSIFDELQRDLQITALQVTSFGAVFMYIYAASQLFIGLLTDCIGGVKVLLTGAILFSIGAILFPLAPNLPLLYLSRGFVGFGASMFYVSLVQIAAQAFPKQFTVLMGWLLLIGCFGGIAANAPFVFFVQKMGWINTLLVIGIITAVAGILVTLLALQGGKGSVKKVKFDLSLFPKVLKDKNNIVVYLSMGICFGIYYVIHTTVGKKFLEDFCEMGAASAAMVLSVMGIMSAAASFLCVYISRLLKDRKKLFFIMSAIVTASSTLLIIFCIISGVKSSVIVLFFWLLSYFCNIAPINLTVLRDINPPERLGTAVSCGNCFSYLMVAFLGSASGFFMDLFPAELINGIPVYGKMSYLSLFIFLFLLSLPALYCAFRVPEITVQKTLNGEK